MITTIESRVKCIIAEQLGVDLDAVTDEKRLVEDLVFDSLDEIELVMALEEEFGIEIPDDEAEKIKTVQDVVQYITRRVSE